MKFKKTILLLTYLFFALINYSHSTEKPNVIYLMLDEWGYFESSHMNNPYLITPNIDKMAAEGMRFTEARAGAPVCGPTRCVLLTGLHSGHTSMRINNGFMPIRENEPTLANMLKSRGYVCGGFGKWGIGGRGTSGVPEKHGFDTFFGYYDQVHAHTFFPSYLIHNSREVPLKGNPNINYYEGETHAQDVIFDESIKFIKENHKQPFFCYLPWTPPHGLWGIKENDPSWQLFKDKPWKAGQQLDRDAKVYAAFMHKVDDQLGQVMQLLKELKIDENTIIFICGDNGGQAYFPTEDHPHGFFGPNLNPNTGERFRAGKGSLYEGGLRIPFIARWPGKIEAGSISNHKTYFPDIMPTLADISGAVCSRTDGISILPTLLNSGHQHKHEVMYWEYQSQIALHYENWKGYKKGNKPWELYDLSKDKEEKNNLANQYPNIVKRIAAYAKVNHQPAQPGTIYNRDLTEKDHAAAPAKNKKKRK